jgi:methylase of polypeptide subunit release factors
LNAAMPRSRVGRILDLGCGAGTLALLLRPHADSVVATDMNARAVEFTRFNAEINEIETDVREGDLFGPVRGEQFDLIVSQPPYYPGSDRIFLHGGFKGTELTERMLAEVRSFLTPSGHAVIHTSLPLDHLTPEGVTEYTPGIGEIGGTRHSLLVVSRSSRTECIEVLPDRWGREGAISPVE